VSILEDGYIQVYYGDGKGKTTAAIGQGIRAIGKDKKVIMIQFLNESDNYDAMSLKKLEPEFKVFNFVRKKTDSTNASEEVKTEVNTALNFAKKIFDTAECDVLILDEVIAAVDRGYIKEEIIYDLLEHKPNNISVILTGRVLLESIAKKSDYIYYIRTEKKPL
jgi:cob(I)alamin adenosyltransferase